MRKILGLAIVLCLLTSAPAYSQFDWGIKAGINLTEKPSSLKDVSNGNRNGFFFGPMAKILIPVLNIGLEANLLYSQTENDIYGNCIKRHNIELPIYLRYDFALPILDRIIEPFIAIGPQFGWTMGSHDGMSNREIWDTASNTIVKEIGKWEYKKSNLSINLGVGAIVLDHIQLHLNYNIAIGQTGEWKSFVSDRGWREVDSKINTWQVSAAYIF